MHNGGCLTDNEAAKKFLSYWTEIPEYFFKHTRIVNKNERKGSWLFSSCLHSFLKIKENVNMINKINDLSIKNNKPIILIDLMNLLYRTNASKAINILLNKTIKGIAGYERRDDLVNSFVNLKQNNFIIVMIGHNVQNSYHKYNDNAYLFGIPCFETVNNQTESCINTSIGHNESDDYLLTFLYGYFRSLHNNNVFLLTADKYRWYTEYEDMKYSKLEIIDGIGQIIITENIPDVNDVITIINNNKQKENVKPIQNVKQIQNIKQIQNVKPVQNAKQKQYRLVNK